MSRHLRPRLNRRPRSPFFVTLSLVAVLCGAIYFGATPGSSATTDLFFSEYVEGSSNNKALEIYNGTGAAVTFGGAYTVELYSNGATAVTNTLTLDGTVADGDVYVIANAQAVAAILAQSDVTSNVTNYNGDDAVVLRKNGAIVDVIGQVGNDPGTEWGSGLTSTLDNTIRRKASICAGDTNAGDAFDPSVQWDGFANNTFDGLGVHTADCEGGGDPTPTPTPTPTPMPTSAAINQIQGGGSISPLVGARVTTTGVVTGIKSNGFFIQNPNPDADPNTSEAVFVFTNSAPSTVIGNEVGVTGTVDEFRRSADNDPGTITQLAGSPTTVTLSVGNAPPAPLSSAIFDPNAESRNAELEKYEGMLVRVDSLTVSQPSNNFGEFWGVTNGRPRPYREPGIERGEAIPPADEGAFAGTVPPNVPRFDGNLERILVDSDDQFSSTGVRRAGLQVSTGAIVTDIYGPLDYGFDQYRILLDAAAAPVVTAGITAAVPVPARGEDEFTVASANLLNFSASSADFQNRLAKGSLFVRNILRTPDVLGVIEVNDLNALQQLADRINADADDATGVFYAAYLENDPQNSQDTGFLVNVRRVDVVGTPVQFFRGKQFVFNGVIDTLHDRPPYVLTIDVPRPGATEKLRVAVMLNHTRSFIEIESAGTGARNREKRRLQAEDIADLIEARENENLVMMGDLNAFQFNNGYDDPVATMKGTPTPPDQVVEPSADRWSHQLTNLVDGLPQSEQYSFVFEGTAQVLDHILVNDNLLRRFSRFTYAHNNADFAQSFAADATRPERLSDHDTPIAYFTLGAAAPVEVTSQTSVTSSSMVFNRATRTFNSTITITNTSGTTMDAPVQLVFDDLTSGVTLVNATGTFEGDPYITATTTNLAPGASVQVVARFNNPSNVRIGYTPRVYSGGIQ